MKLLFIITGLSLGGAETQLVRVATRLRARGWEIRVVSMLMPEAYVDDLEEASIPVISLGIKKGVPPVRALWRLRRVIRTWKPHIVHSYMVHANLLARLIRPFARVPVLICSIRSITERGKKGSGRMREILYRLTDSLCDLTTQVTRAGLERYVRIKAVPRHKIRYIPNGIDTDEFKPDPTLGKHTRGRLGLADGAFVWLAVGGFRREKDYPTMLRAFASVVKNHPKTVLLIAGDGPLRLEMEALAARMGMADNVRFLGWQRDVPALMNAADAYLMSSAWEGMPNVLLEAGACGLPVVATDVGGNREVVLEGISGFLVPPEDPQALAEAMKKMMALPAEERKAMGRAACRHIRANFDLEYVVDLWESLYKEVWRKKQDQG